MSGRCPIAGGHESIESANQPCANLLLGLHHPLVVVPKDKALVPFDLVFGAWLCDLMVFLHGVDKLWVG